MVGFAQGVDFDTAGRALQFFARFKDFHKKCRVGEGV